ncbi:hypothetical protein F5050DRAFT_544364 [Lentinula boryana]|uniref:Uncharacterized protein n=1 Tax=Lentinula boryana TaxID=40481 RepID=A0ABQ8Q6W0_9AGAR|nr:hypothetical protein F5050DRAFT_544364 [Lentinula boryana]
MYRNVSSPIFDVPEFPTLRRVKPLPKSRRTSSTHFSVLNPGTTNSTDSGVENAPRMLVAESNGVPHSLHMPGLPPIPLSLPGPDATAEELLAHADALQSYYLPILDAAAANINAVADGFANAVEPGSVPLGSDIFDFDLSNFASSYGVGLAGLGINNLSLRDRDEDSTNGDGDYIDHMQQPANTKKRKVPANMSRLQGAHDSASGQSVEDEAEDHDGTLMIGIPTGTFDPSTNDGNTGQGDAGGAEGEGKSSMSTMRRLLARRKTRLSAVTLAGLQHKETLRVRKRQLATVLGALSHGDTLALDQALSNNSAYPFSAPSSLTSNILDEMSADSGLDARGAAPAADGRPSLRIRLSKRAGPRLARRAPLRLKENEEPRVQVPESDFAFVCHSATAERLSATKKEVATLRRRFEDELARQASNAASLAAATRAVASSVNSRSSRQKRGDRPRSDKKPRDQTTDHLEPTGNGQVSGAGGVMTTAQGQLQDNSGDTTSPNVKSSRSGKKKKRSALANASNPHHLRNYVPSRLPHSAGGCPPNVNGTNQANANDLGPLPLRFLSAEIPPRRGTRSKRSQAQEQQQASLASMSLINPADEWLCVFCEFQLFFGDDAEYRRALNKRKNILKRRRRARERAAAAASGQNKVSNARKSHQPAASVAAARDSEEGDDEDDYEDDAEYEPIGTGGQVAGNGVNGMLPKQTKWRGDNREKGAGEEESSYG